MTDLMKELMAEVARVNKMKVEVERTVELQNDAVQAQRKEKAQDIALSLQTLCDALIEADAMRGTFFILPGVSYKEPDGYNRYVGIVFKTDGIHVGKYYPGSGDCPLVESFSHAVNHLPVTKAMKALIDAWDNEMELRVEEACMKQIKQTLKNRMEAMQNTLQKSNDEYAKYVR